MQVGAIPLPLSGDSGDALKDPLAVILWGDFLASCLTRT